MPGESHGQKSLAGCRPQGRKELDMTEHVGVHSWLTFAPPQILTTLESSHAPIKIKWFTNFLSVIHSGPCVLLEAGILEWVPECHPRFLPRKGPPLWIRSTRGLLSWETFPWHECLLYYYTLLSGPYMLMCAKSLSHIRLFASLWVVAYQAPLSTELSRQEYWSGLPFPSPGDLPDSGIEPHVLCLMHWQVSSLPLAPSGKPQISICLLKILPHLLFKGLMFLFVLFVHPKLAWGSVAMNFVTLGSPWCCWKVVDGDLWTLLGVEPLLLSHSQKNLWLHKAWLYIHYHSINQGLVLFFL